MTDYISRKSVLQILSDKNAAWDAYQKVQALPTADVRPVARGKWEIEHCDDGYGGYDLFVHKECGCLQANKSNFCRFCGADMKEEQK